MTDQRKAEWQRQKRKAFRDEHGYSLSSHYGAGGNREAVLTRDNFCCVKCGMTDAQHKNEWGKPITVDHISKNRRDNSMENLQTLCLRCHGNKDLIARLRQQRVPQHKQDILARRSHGQTYQSIAADLGFCAMAIWNWCKRWEREVK